MSQLEKAPLASGPTQNWLPWGCLVSNLGQCSRIWSELSPGYKDPHPALHLIIHHEGARPELGLNFKADLRHAPVALPDPRNPMEAPHAHDLTSVGQASLLLCSPSQLIHGFPEGVPSFQGPNSTGSQRDQGFHLHCSVSWPQSGEEKDVMWVEGGEGREANREPQGRRANTENIEE